MSHTFSRAELYRLVWSEPLRALAKLIGVSDVAIGKRCREAAVPLPGIGYWAQKQAGKAGPHTPLPPRALGQSDRITIGGRYYYEPGPSDDELIAMLVPGASNVRPIFAAEFGFLYSIMTRWQTESTRPLATVYSCWGESLMPAARSR